MQYNIRFMKVFISLGTNLGNREQNLRDAVAALEGLGRVVSQSPLYATEPWGFVSDNGFLNMVVAIESELLPMELLVETQRIERELGREKKSDGMGYSDRLIDIDLLDCGGAVVDSDQLQLPHPRLHLRNFVLYPLCDIAPDWRHPLLDQTSVELKQNSPDHTVPQRL